MHYISLIDARNQLADVMNQVASAKERVMITRHGEELAAVVAIKDVKRLEALKAKKTPVGR